MSENSFHYTYSAQQTQEVLRIRKKYLPQEESKLEELKRLDQQVHSSGVLEALCAGISGALVFGLGLCLAMEVIGNAVWLGILFGLVGAIGMMAAYPVYRKIYEKVKAQNTPRILELICDMTGGDPS